MEQLAGGQWGSVATSLGACASQCPNVGSTPGDTLLRAAADTPPPLGARTVTTAALPLQGVPQAPMCGFSNMACAILNLYGVFHAGRLAWPMQRGCTCCLQHLQCRVEGSSSPWRAAVPGSNPLVAPLPLMSPLDTPTAAVPANWLAAWPHSSLPLPAASPAGVEFGSRNVLADPEIREGVKRFTAWPTIPQACDTACASFTGEQRL